MKVAMVEAGGRVDTANPYLPGVTLDTTYSCAQTTSNATQVAGIIRSIHATKRGVAPGVTLWAGGSCAGLESQVDQQAAAAADWGARVLNLSLGGPAYGKMASGDRFLDELVWTRRISVVVSAGNGGGYVYSPAQGYNVLTAGAFVQTFWTTWDDDVMLDDSSYLDPFSAYGDREKPEVVAPGSGIYTTSPGVPWLGYTLSGTSLAAPVITGAAALAIQRSGWLKYYPEAVRAILMCTAVHNVEGDARLSDKDGAGGIVTDRADLVAQHVFGAWGAMSGFAGTSEATSLYLYAGMRER